MLPSTSSIQTPLPRSATSLNDGRGYDGFTNFASASTIFLPLGPGSSVLISGRFGVASTVLDICLTPFRMANNTPKPVKVRPGNDYENDKKTSRRKGSRVIRAGDSVRAAD